MSDNAVKGTVPSQATSDRDDLVRALTVERLTKWKPSPSTSDRTEVVACPTVRDGLPFQPFQPITRSVRARKYRRFTADSGRNS